MTADLTWFGDAILARMLTGMAAGMEAAGRIAVASEQRLIGQPGPPASAVGQPPHRRSGKLQQAQGYRVERNGRTVDLVVTGAKPGTPGAAYAKYVHARRPWVVKGVTDVRTEIVNAIVGGIASGLRGTP